MRTAFVLTACLLLATPGAFGLALPPAPAGYSWAQCPEIGGALLKPEHWSFRRHTEAGKLAYFVTKEPWTPPDSFDVGLTFNIVFNVPEVSGLQPTEYARRYVSRVAKAHSEASTWTNKMGPFQAEGVEYLGTGAAKGYKFFNLIIANNKTGTAYVVIFEAPASSWDAEWQSIEPSIKSLVIDDEY